MSRIALHFVILVVLTLLTQIGGLVWLLALMFRQRVVAFFALYVTASVAAVWAAPIFGREALSCWDRGALQVHSWFFCALNRTYVTLEMKAVLMDVAARVDQAHPGTVTQVLDASFPFIDGFPMIPHLSHDDGEKVDLAFYYRDETGYVPGWTRSPIGFFAFEQGPTNCPTVWPSMRWDLGWAQPFFPSAELDKPRVKSVLVSLIADQRVGKIFVEPHVRSSLGLSDQKLRFQGCRAARHDDHIHLQL